MKCPDCGGTFIQLSDTFEYDDNYVGKIRITGIPYYKCDQNGEILLTLEMADAIETERKRLIKEYLKKYPFDDFVNAKNTWELLGITRQALNKNRRIRNGFIYCIDYDGNKFFLKQSVILYKNTGDGRFPLYYQANPSQEVIINTIDFTIEYDRYTKSEITKASYSDIMSSDIMRGYSTKKEGSYAIN